MPANFISFSFSFPDVAGLIGCYCFSCILIYIYSCCAASIYGITFISNIFPYHILLLNLIIHIINHFLFILAIFISLIIYSNQISQKYSSHQLISYLTFAYFKKKNQINLKKTMKSNYMFQIFPDYKHDYKSFLHFNWAIRNKWPKANNYLLHLCHVV